MTRTAILAATIFAAAPALAEVPECAPTDVLVSTIVAEWGELPLFVGDAGVSGIGLLRNPANGSWTLIRADNTGTSCRVAQGIDSTIYGALTGEGV